MKKLFTSFINLFFNKPEKEIIPKNRKKYFRFSVFNIFHFESADNEHQETMELLKFSLLTSGLVLFFILVVISVHYDKIISLANFFN